MNFVFALTSPTSLSVQGRSGRFALRRVYCVGRNYEEHAKEMGFTGRAPPFFFMKPWDAVAPGDVMNGGVAGLCELKVRVDAR